MVSARSGRTPARSRARRRSRAQPPGRDSPELQLDMKGTWDRTRTWISELFVPGFFATGGTGQGTSSFFRFTHRDSPPAQHWAAIGLPADDNRHSTCTAISGAGRSTRDAGHCRRRCRRNAARARPTKRTTRAGSSGSARATPADGRITKNLWQTRLSAAQSPWNAPLSLGHPIVDAAAEEASAGEGSGELHIVGNVMPSSERRGTTHPVQAAHRCTASSTARSVSTCTIRATVGPPSTSARRVRPGRQIRRVGEADGYAWRVGRQRRAGPAVSTTCLDRTTTARSRVATRKSAR